MIFDFIDLRYFIFAFAFGMLIVYTTTPPPEVIIKYPTPENAGKIIYKDDAGICYKYRAEEIKCPSDSSKIKAQPLQHTE